jgi:hypothetical protein
MKKNSNWLTIVREIWETMVARTKEYSLMGVFNTIFGRWETEVTKTAPV